MTSTGRLLWKAGRLRSFAEGWIISAGLMAALMPTVRLAPSLVVSAYFVLVIMVGDGIAGLRLAFAAGERKQIVIREVLNSLIFAGGLFALIMAELYLFAALDLPAKCHVGLTGFWIFMLLISPGFLVIRVYGKLSQFWDRLRRTHVVWGLTHAILIVIGSLGVMILLGAVFSVNGVYDVSYLKGLPLGEIVSRLIIWILALFITMLAAAIAGILIFLLPAAAFSYLVARRLTGRLDSLVVAARALESGDLSHRIAVEGEDEVAMLQRTFNSMAENLQGSVTELEDERKKVGELLRTQQELTAGVSHELRTPVAVISGYLESLRARWQTEPPEVVDRDLETVSAEAVRLKKILNDLLDLSQASVNRLSIHLEPVSLAAPIQHTVSAFKPMAWESKRVEVAAEIPAETPLILADPTRLEQVLFNLVQNGLRHTSPGGLVSISVQASADWVQVEVADSGEGISPDDLPNIWNKFYRGNGSARSGDGAGLGLAIVKELTEAMGGQVDVESTPGEGSVFILRFQIVR